MRAAFIESHGGVEKIKVGVRPDPSLPANEVLVRVRFAALNHLDIWVREGFPGLQLKFPHILGSDATGVVEKVGTDVIGWNVGDEVIVHPGMNCGICAECLADRESLCPKYQILGEPAPGTFAELVVVPPQNLFKIPKGLTLQTACGIALVYTTAYEMLFRKAGLKAGQEVLIHAAGSGVSTAGIQLAAAAGAIVTATSRSPEKLEVARKLGAKFTICLAEEDFAKAYRKLHGHGPDVIFDHVGSVTWEKNIRLLKSGGTLVICGATSGAKPETDLNHVFFRQLRILGSTMGSKKDFPAILEGFAQGRYQPVIDRVFPLENTVDAVHYLQSATQQGKVLISLD